jgi:hypothetical protein
VPFASDASGNDWSFDTRTFEAGEYAIVWLDHEEPPDDEELEGGYEATAFDEWLQGVVADRDPTSRLED